jgi:hypothetical protein
MRAPAARQDGLLVREEKDAMRRKPAPGAIAVRARGRYRTLALLLLGVGLACRTALYLLNHPLFQDEAYVALNVVDRDYLGLTRPLDANQVAPLVFLWGERAACEALGTAEQALRLAPFLAGITALVLFWHLARRVVSPAAAAVAVGLLAVSRWPVHVSCQVKPYSLDLLFSVVLLSLAVHWLRRPERLRWLVLLVLATPVAVASSYPVVFVAGGVGIVVLVAAWWGRWTVRLLAVASGVLLAGSFLVFDVMIGQRQLGPPGERVHDFMMRFWAEAFPPPKPVPLTRWLVATHFGPLMAYPSGNGSGGGTFAFLLFLVGAWQCRRAGRRRLLALCLIPFALTLAASFLHKYPYGGCNRLSQHLAPAVCLLAGVGLVRVVRLALRRPARRRQGVWAVGGSLAVLGLGMVVSWYLVPYRELDDQGAKSVGVAVMTHARPGDPVMIIGLPDAASAQISWYVRVNGGRPLWNEFIHADDLPVLDGPVWLLTPAYDVGGPRPTRVQSGETVDRRPPGPRPRATFTLPGREGARPALCIDLWHAPVQGERAQCR